MLDVKTFAGVWTQDIWNSTFGHNEIWGSENGGGSVDVDVT